MPVLTDFQMSKFEDGILVVEMEPPQPIGGWLVRFQVMKRFGSSSGLIEKWMGSGGYNVSGMDIVNSGQGLYQATINSLDTSGLDYGAYAFQSERMDSGFRTVLNEGYFMLVP